MTGSARMLSANRSPRPGPARHGPVPPRLQGRLLVVGATLLFVWLLTGCLSIGDGKVHEIIRTEVVEPAGPLVGDGVFEQSGGTHIPSNSEQDIYYPVPYVSPPNLTLAGDSCELLTQARDHFRVKTIFSGSITWRAKGVKVLLTQTPPPDPTLTPSSPGSPSVALPSQPIPYVPQPTP